MILAYPIFGDTSNTRMGPKVAKGNYLQEPRFWSSFSSQRDELTLRSSTKGGASMSTYVSLVNWTEQGIKNYKDTASRTESCSGTLTDYQSPADLASGRCRTDPKRP